VSGGECAYQTEDWHTHHNIHKHPLAYTYTLSHAISYSYIHIEDLSEIGVRTRHIYTLSLALPDRFLFEEIIGQSLHGTEDRHGADEHRKGSKSTRKRSIRELKKNQTDCISNALNNI
jgi:hypothetical protein